MPDVTTADLAKVKAACDAATPGPWYAVLFADKWEILLRPKYEAQCVLSCSEPNEFIEGGVSDPKAKTNAELVTLARTWLPRLAENNQDLRDAIKLIIGRDTNTPWQEVRNEDVDGCVRTIREYKRHPRCGTRLKGKSDA